MIPLDPHKRKYRDKTRKRMAAVEWKYTRLGAVMASGPATKSPSRMQSIRAGGFAVGPEAITAPCQVSFQSTEGIRFLVESSSFRLCGSRGMIPLVRSGLKAQRNPFVCFPIATFTLHTNAVNSKFTNQKAGSPGTLSGEPVFCYLDLSVTERQAGFSRSRRRRA